MKCANPECGSGKPVFARGLCQGCYYRVRRRGVLGRKYQPGGSSGVCKVDDCERGAHSQGLCSKHYQQASSPMRNVWKVLRSRAQGAYPPHWDDFDAFMSDVGERPSDAHQLRRLDPTLPWNIGNMAWREPVAASFKDDKAHYHWVRNLRVKYDLTPEQAQMIYDHQKGLCLLCNQPLGYFGPTGRKEATVIVDHDHLVPGLPKQQAVRGITHRVCNSGMGQMGDSIDNMQRGIAMLSAHEHRKTLGISIIDEIKAKEQTA